MTKNFETSKKFYNSLNFSFSITCLSETLANDNNPGKNSLFQLEGYNPVHQIRKNCNGDGIVIFIRDSLLYKIREDLRVNCDDIESLSIEIVNYHSKTIIFNVVYRPPDGDLSLTETFLRKIISENTKANKTLFLAGRFNINVLDYENKKKVQNCANLTFKFSMMPTTNKSTRVTSYTTTAIDNIITNPIFDNDFESAIIKTDVSDLFTAIFMTKLKTTSSPKNHVDQFLKIFSSLYQKGFQSTKVKLKPKRNKSPWITNGIPKSSKRKQKLYEKFLKRRTPEYKETYEGYKNLFQMIKRKFLFCKTNKVPR